MRAYNGRRIDWSQPPAATRKGFSMGVKMFEYLRLADDTQVSYSEPREFVRNNAPVIMNFAWEGGFAHA